MNIVNFTPQSAFVGGIIIGLAVIIFFIGNGRLAGISGIVNNALVSKQNRTDNFLFIIGLVLGPIFYAFFAKIDIPFVSEDKEQIFFEKCVDLVADVIEGLFKK